VAHDLRNPLFGLSATLDAFAQSFGANADVAPYLEVLRRELARIEALATDLLAYGRPDAGELAPASLEPVLRAASASCGALAARQGVLLRVECALDDARVAMSRPRLERVFENLLQNAIQQSTRGGQVVLRAARGENGTALCTVEDEGPGFPAGDLPRIFEPFFSRRRGGTGLGLAIAQRTIEHHHGRIGASNRPDGGAVISVHLPLA
jgi:signal transduction histidine kinase